MLKVLLIRNASYDDFGGGERFPVFLADALNTNGYSTVVVARSDKILNFARSNKIRVKKGWWWARQNWSGTRALLFPLYFIWQLVLFSWYIYLFVKESPSVVHIQSKDDFIAGTIAGKILGKKVVWTDHADLKHVWKNVRLWYKNPIGKLVYLSALLADDIIAVSRSEIALIFANLPLDSKIRNKLGLVYNGVADKKTRVPTKKGLDEFVFITANRLVTDKGIKECIEAFNVLSKRNPHVKLNILGSGPEEDRFKELAKSNDKIEFFGHLEDPIREMAKADVFLQPTYHEAFSVVLVEAAMLGLPIIATDVGGNPEIIIDGQNGILVEAKNSGSIYEAMKKLYENKTLRNKLGARARETFKSRFDFKEIVKQYIDIYEK